MPPHRHEQGVLWQLGAEANEGAIKAARKYSFDRYGAGRDQIITLKNSFHGRTLATLTATGQDGFHQFFGPFNDGFLYAAAGDLDALTKLVDEHTCAIMLELIQGEGGVVPLDPAFVLGVRSLCDDRDLVLIVDEVQTGVGRTGTFLACEQYNLRPDIVTLAKGLGGGLPIGAVLLNDRVAGCMGPGTHGSTFGATRWSAPAPTWCWTGLSDSFLAGVRQHGEQLREGLEKLPHVTAVDGMGLMLGVQFEEGITAQAVLDACRERGLLVLTAKTRMRLLPPLIVTAHDIERALTILDEVLCSMAPAQR